MYPFLFNRSIIFIPNYFVKTKPKQDKRQLMSQLRSEDMTLLQVMISREQGYEIIAKLLELDMVHYVDLNKNVMPNKLFFTEFLKRAEETSKKI